MVKMIFYDDNTRSWWTPITGGANISTLYDLLPSFGIVLGEKNLKGDFFIDGEQSRYASGTDIVKFPKGGFVHSFSFLDSSKSGTTQNVLQTSGLMKILDFTNVNIRDSVLFLDSVRQKDPLCQNNDQLPSRRTDMNFSTYSAVLGKEFICRSDYRYEIWGTKGYILQQIGRNRRLPGFPSIDMGKGLNPTMERFRFWHNGSPKKNERNSFTTSGRYAAVFAKFIPPCKFLVTSKEATMAHYKVVFQSQQIHAHISNVGRLFIFRMISNTPPMISGVKVKTLNV
ncbi:hypothetical protein GIB67_011942 [Kingdonia uniflora]|uniref:MBTPS1 fourth domain-containing protein n=1 Tax=Kingdonia uniflora TaxID=39325 RepID=A0A7J7LZY3_9MAGN|nr:hypothetical protein GIB67_011942 [Kingdonia uniflora]